MATWKSLVFTLAFIASSAVAQPAQEENAPDEDRNLLKHAIETPLAKEAAKAKFEPSAVEDRHKEEVILNPRLPKIVTYWRSELATKATFVEPETNLKVEVPKMVRGKDKITIVAVANAPIKGDATGRMLSDDRKELLKISSPFTANVKVTAECTLTRVVEKGEAKVQIVIKEWTPILEDVKFQNEIVDKLREPIKQLANNKLREAAIPLKEAANNALKKAYDDGKLKFNP
jgi:hypothetical protein